MALKVLAGVAVLLIYSASFAKAHPHMEEMTAMNLEEVEGEESTYLSVYLYDPSNGKYLSRIYRNGWHSIEAAKNTPDVYCQFKMYVLGDNLLSFQADNGQYLSRILYGISAYADGNYIQAAKPSADYFSQFPYKFKFANPPSERPNSIGLIALQSDNGRYWGRFTSYGVEYIKPLSVDPVYFELIIAH